nr:endonuclease [Vogesella oryzae]
MNGDRGNFSYGAWTRNLGPMHGQYMAIVDFANKRVQPCEEVRGRATRISLYTHIRYNLNISKQDRQLWCVWAKTYPVTRGRQPTCRHSEAVGTVLWISRESDEIPCKKSVLNRGNMQKPK